ncbi:MAG TPA: caspase family protein [Thermoanaerobaculia bacterium]
MAIVQEVRTIYQSKSPNYKAILEKLRIAQDLCPLSPDVWKYAYCSALAIGDQQGARRFKQRAIDNDIEKLDCEGERLAVPRPEAPLSPYVREKYALIVGIGTFSDPKIKELRFAAKDAADFANALKDPAFGRFRPSNVTLLTDKNATRQAVLSALQSIILQAHDDDLVVIYVSSHGSGSQQDQGLGGRGYIVTYDSESDKIWNNAIEYETFAHQTSLIKARRKVTFLDTCFSGQASGGAKALEIDAGGVDEQTSKMFASNEGSFVITSSNSTEESWESEALHNSYFTHFLIEALRRSKEPPTMKQIFEYIAAKVPEAVAREQKKPQHPQIQPSDGPEDITIGVAPRRDVR